MGPEIWEELVKNIFEKKYKITEQNYKQYLNPKTIQVCSIEEFEKLISITNGDIGLKVFAKIKPEDGSSVKWNFSQYIKNKDTKKNKFLSDTIDEIKNNLRKHFSIL